MDKKKKKQKDNSAHALILPIERKDPGARAFYWISFAILTLVALISFVPPIWVFTSAFKDIKEFLMMPPTIIPRSFQPEKIITAWQEARFGRAYLNTIIMGTGNVICSVTFNGLAGYTLSRLKPKGYMVVFTLITWTMMMPSSVCMVPLFMDLCELPIIGVNITNTFIPFWIMSSGGCFTILLFKSFFDSINISYIEAARIDGCSELGIFFRIIVPLSKPIMFTVMVFALNGIWGDFLWPYLILRKDELLTTGVKIYKAQTANPVDIQFMMMFFVTIPPVIIYLFLQKYMMKGISLGGVKG